nr:hypothetical protein [Elizabethkingia sp. ASV34]
MLNRHKAKIFFLQSLLLLQFHSPVSYTHLTLPTTVALCRSRWAPDH